MVILTCANAEKDNFEGKAYENFSFRELIGQTMATAKRHGYRSDVYDLGTLGIGESYRIEDRSFIEKGYYQKELKNGYKSKSIFKPELVKLSMSKHDELVVYLDGDAQLCANIDEVDTDDYDIGVTLRDVTEFGTDWYRDNVEIVKYVNAGVIFFRPTERAREFVAQWARLTDELGNDQMALNALSSPEDYPEPWSVRTLNGVRVKYFPARIYNFYYFTEIMPIGAKIFHFKGSVRKYYPFDFKKRLFCCLAVPLRNLGARLKNMPSSR